MLRVRDERHRSSAESDVQLLVAGNAGAERSSAAGDPGDGGRHTCPVVATIRQHVRERRPTFDSSGEAVARAVAADAVFDSQRTAADGRRSITVFCFAGLWD